MSGIVEYGVKILLPAKRERERESNFGQRKEGLGLEGAIYRKMQRKGVEGFGLFTYAQFRFCEGGNYKKMHRKGGEKVLVFLDKRDLAFKAEIIEN